ncbi:hypothetical protein SELMODRAFT_409072 [Selaginella moellendorffii]|uniref:Integral membrane bound transporter domain-containing protein n=1 Tax=Selaginella moellendorffii TaxID=88036 RepID=D8R9C3_SELML|nr:hypothetical protein SELMODRAFT_409072 [Selaginella moellendorffii]
MWKSRLLSSARTGVACLIAALLLQYAHGYVKWTSFPAFSFILSFVIVSECPSLAKVMRDSWSVLFGGIQGLSLGMLAINLLGPSVSIWTSLMFIFWSSMVIAYPSFSNLLTKRVALTVATHLHVIAYARQQDMDRIFYPLKLGATMVLGLACSILALTFPFPKFASVKARQQLIQSIEIISQAFDALLTMFCTRERFQRQSLRFQAKSLMEAGSKVILEVHNTDCFLPFAVKAKSNYEKQVNKLMQHVKAMELAMNSSSCSDQELSDSAKASLEETMSQVREWSKSFAAKMNHPSGKESVDSDKLLKDGKEIMSQALETALSLQDPSQLQAQICGLSFAHNARLFLAEATTMLQTTPNLSKVRSTLDTPESTPVSASPCCKLISSVDPIEESKSEKETEFHWGFFSQILKLYDRERFIVALKISLAMVLGSYAGSTYNRYHINWTTLIIGMGFNAHRDGSFRVSDLRLHGMVLGTIFGYLVSFYTQSSSPIFSIVALAGWIVFTSFMKHNRFYGPLGNVSALIGAIFLVGHRKRVPLDSLAMLRLTQSFIGIAAFVVVEYLVFPRKVSVLAKSTLAAGLAALERCAKTVVSAGVDVARCCCERCQGSALEELGQARQEASSIAQKLGVLVQEAALEPCWTDPFQEKAYAKILSSHARILDLLQALVMSILELRSRRLPWCCKTLQDLQAPCFGPVLVRLDTAGGGGDVESQSASVDLVDVDCWSSSVVDACRSRFQEVMATAGDDRNWEDTVVFGAFIFNAQALAMEFAKIERNVLKLMSLDEK